MIYIASMACAWILSMVLAFAFNLDVGAIMPSGPGHRPMYARDQVGLTCVLAVCIAIVWPASITVALMYAVAYGLRAMVVAVVDLFGDKKQ